jgi:hypothetical protein
MRYLELMNVGVQWSTLSLLIYEYSYWLALRNGIITILFYQSLYMYCDQIIPSEFGIPRKWNFLCLPKFWKEEVFGKEQESSSSAAGGAAAGGAAVKSAKGSKDSGDSDDNLRAVAKRGSMDE